MDIINKYISTLVATLVFITAIELIAPDNSLKKYLKFVMGLILISVLLNPIIKLFTGGEQAITDAIEKYEQEFSGEKYASSSSTEEEIDIRKNNFINNFNKNCESMLKKEFKDIKFTSDVDCNVDFNEFSFTINKLTIGIKDSGIEKIDKIVLGEDKKVEEEDEVIIKIKDYLSSELGINKDKIEVIHL